MVKIRTHWKVSLSSFFALLLLGFLAMGTVHASDDSTISEVLEESKIEITVTNDQTGETKELDLPELENDVEVKSVESSDNTGVAGYEVFVPLEEPDNLITPFTIGGGNKTSGGITAKVYADYNWRSSSQELRINRVYGSWTPTSSLYYVTNREVRAHNGSIWGQGVKKLRKYPTSNSFSYTTGWGYAETVIGDHSALIETTAKGNVSGMGSTSHTINLRVYIPN